MAITQDTLDALIRRWDLVGCHSAHARVEVCIIAPKILPQFDSNAPGVIGGAETDMYYLATELAKDSDFGVHVIHIGDGPAWQIREHVWLWQWTGGAFALWRLMRWIDADVYMLKTFSWGVPWVWLWCRLNGKKFVYRMAHDWEVDGTFRHKRPILHWLFRSCLERSDVVLFQTQKQKRLYNG